MFKIPIPFENARLGDKHMRFKRRNATVIRYSVIGAVGYVCGELLRMMVAHPEGKLVNVLDTYGVGDKIYVHHPHLRLHG